MLRMTHEELEWCRNHDPTCSRDDYTVFPIYGPWEARIARLYESKGYTVWAMDFRLGRCLCIGWKKSKADKIFVVRRDEIAIIRQKEGVAGKMGRSEHPADPAETKPAD